MLIHRPLGGDERYKPARAHLIQCAGEKVIVDQETVLVIPLVVEGIAAERDVADGKVEKAVRQFGILKALHRDTVLLVKLLGNPPGDGIQFHAEQLAVLHALRHKPKEIADPARWLRCHSEIDTM